MLSLYSYAEDIPFQSVFSLSLIAIGVLIILMGILNSTIVFKQLILVQMSYSSLLIFIASYFVGAAIYIESIQTTMTTGLDEA